MKLKGFLVFWLLFALGIAAFAKGGGGGGGHGGGGHASSGHASSGHSTSSHSSFIQSNNRPTAVTPPARGNGCSDESRNKGKC